MTELQRHEEIAAVEEGIRAGKLGIRTIEEKPDDRRQGGRSLSVKVGPRVMPGVFEGPWIKTVELRSSDGPPPANLANEVRNSAYSDRMRGAKVQFEGPPLPTDETIRAVTHPRTHARAEIGSAARVDPTARVEEGAQIGDGARVGREAVIGRDARVEGGAVVPPGTEVPAHETFRKEPERGTAEKQQAWIESGARKVAVLDDMTRDNYERAGVAPPDLPDRGHGHAADAATQQQERDGQAR